MPREQLNQLFAAERDLRDRHADLVELASDDRDALMAATREAIAAAQQLDDDEEANLRLVACARLLGALEGGDVADALIDVLASDVQEARAEAGEQLQGLAFDRFKEVALATERAVERLPSDSPALCELPFVLAEVPEGGVALLLGRFLGLDDADVVGAAIEAAVEAGDPAIAPQLEKLLDDRRLSSLGEEVDGPEGVAIGELAAEALALLMGADDGSA